MKTISQRSEFVTSDYRHKLVQALDFRNRFAERPFLCKDLIMPDQIVVSTGYMSNHCITLNDLSNRTFTVFFLDEFYLLGGSFFFA